MHRARRFAKPLAALLAAAAILIVATGCAIVKPGSFSVSQPGGVGAARVHLILCTAEEFFACGPNEESEDLQYLLGIAVPPGSNPPASFTATPIGGGSPIVFNKNDEVASQVAASSAQWEALLNSAETPKEKEEAEKFRQIVGGTWPPNGLQGVGYLSGPVAEVEKQTIEWSVDADFGLPSDPGGSPFVGPFASALAIGYRGVSPSQSPSRPVRCAKFEEGKEPDQSEAVCLGTTQQSQVGTSDLRIAGPKKPGEAFVGGSGDVAFSMKFGSTAGAVPTFALSATTAAKGGKAKPKATSFKPGAVNATTHLSPNGTAKVTVTVPKKLKPGTYQVTLSAKAPQGGTVSGTGKLKVVKPTLKFGATKIDASKGTATIKVKVPGAGKVTVSGKGIKKTKKKAKKKGTVKLKVQATGSTAAFLATTGSAKVKLKVVFKPKSGVSVSKKKNITLKLK
jgi:hypothetical protein